MCSIDSKYLEKLLGSLVKMAYMNTYMLNALINGNFCVWSFVLLFFMFRPPLLLLFSKYWKVEQVDSSKIQNVSHSKQEMDAKGTN